MKCNNSIPCGRETDTELCTHCGCLNYYGPSEPAFLSYPLNAEYNSSECATGDYCRVVKPRTFARVVAFDTETALIAPNLGAPPMACLTWQLVGGAPQIVGATDACEALLREWLCDEDTLLIGHHTPYDMGVICAQWPGLMPLVFDAYADGRVSDTKIREILLDISEGQYRKSYEVGGKTHARDYSLASIAKRRLGWHLPKDGWRMRYGEFVGVPVSEWLQHASNLRDLAIARVEEIDAMPLGKVRSDLEKTDEVKDLRAIALGDVAEVLEYPKRDAQATLAVWQSQGSEIVDERAQCKYAWWLHLMSCAGLRTLPGSADRFQQAIEADFDQLQIILQKNGLVKANGVRDTKAAQARMLAVCTEAGIEPKLTAGGAFQLGEDACETSGDLLLQWYAEFAKAKKALSTDAKMIEAGGHYVVHTRFGLAETGRTTSSKPNIQNLSSRPGVRECFAPREGYVFAQADYSGLELCTLAQVCLRLFGFSKLAAAINSGQDVHLAMAAAILKTTYEEVYVRRGELEIKSMRKLAKVANFGFPGGLGAAGARIYAMRAPYKLDLSEAEATKLKRDWLETWPEAREYFEYVKNLPKSQTSDRGPTSTLRQVFSGRIRGNCMYTEAANSLFQGLGSDATKTAGFALSFACYCDKKSVLYGSVPVAYVYDEFLIEVPELRGHECAQEMARIMVEAANTFLPDVPVKTEPLLMRVWSKKAEPVYVDGRLVPWVESKHA